MVQQYGQALWTQLKALHAMIAKAVHGMVKKPGSFPGVANWFKSQRRPLASQRVSLAIFIRQDCMPRRGMVE